MKIKEYYKHYLTLHTNKNCIRLHFIGQLITLLYLSFGVYFTFNLSWTFIFPLLFTPFIIYPFTFIGHRFFEKNKPAALTHPFMAKLCNWIMFIDILRGKIKIF